MRNWLKIIEDYIIRTIHITHTLPLQIDITNLCNLACKHCYHPHHNNNGNLALSDWFNILQQYDTLTKRFNYRKKIIICGGEPILSKNFWPILDYLKKNFANCNVVILTNATLINSHFLDQIKQYENIEFQVSLDGSNPTSHDYYRGEGSFKKTISGINTLVNNSFKVKLLAVLSLKKYHEIDSFFSLAKQLRVSQMNFTRFIESGIGRTLAINRNDRSLSANELKDAYHNILACSLKYQLATNLQKPLMNLILPGIGRNGNFWEAIIIDYQGNILASSRSRLKLGHALTDSIEKIFTQHPLLASLRKGDVEKCGKCPHYRSCGGDRNAAYAKTGNFLAADPDCWINVEKQNIQEQQIISI